MCNKREERKKDEGATMDAYGNLHHRYLKRKVKTHVEKYECVFMKNPILNRQK